MTTANSPGGPPTRATVSKKAPTPGACMAVTSTVITTHTMPAPPMKKSSMLSMCRWVTSATPGILTESHATW